MKPDDLNGLFSRANDFLESGKPAEALRCLESVDGHELEEEDRIEWGALRGWALSELGRHEEAIALLTRLIEEFPESVRLLGALGVALSNNDELDDAADVFEEALRLSPSDDVVIANFALVCEKLREYEQALSLYDRALELGADIDWILLRKANVFTECGMYAEAKTSLRRYLSLAPEDAAQWIALGILHSDDDEYDAAYECYRQAEELSPEDASLRLNWGVTAVRGKQLDVARQQLAKLRKIEPDTTRWQLLEAFVSEEEGKAAEARRIYDRILKRRNFRDRAELSYALEMAMDFFARHKLRPRCAAIVARAYMENACTVELCEAYREAVGQYVKKATWYSIVVEADYRAGLEEVRERATRRARERFTRFARDYQVVARDHDEAVGLVLEFARKMGERNPQVREFVGQETIEDTYTGIYEVEPESFVFTPEKEEK